MENSTYKVYLNDKLENETHMEGIAFLQYQSAHMLGKAELIQINGTKQLKYNPDTDSWDLITL